MKILHEHMFNKEGRFMGFFDDIRLYLSDSRTGKLEIKYVCCICGEEISRPEKYTIPCVPGGVAEIWKAKYYCDKCASKLKTMT